MKIDDILDNFDWNISISEKGKVKQKSESPKTSNMKTIAQRTHSNEETAEGDENIPYNSHQAIYTCYLEVVKIMEKV